MGERIGVFGLAAMMAVGCSSGGGEPQGDGGSMCATGTADCNSDSSDGCETDTTSRDHCGGCDVACALSETCATDMCVSPAASILKSLPLSVWDFEVGPDGGLVAVGGFNDPVDFGLGLVAPIADTAAFVAKYSSGGALQWVRKIGDTNRNFGRSVAVDANNNVYMTGSLRGSATFPDIGPVAGDGSDVLLVSYSASGEFRWARVFGSALDAGALDQGDAIAVGSSRVYVAGVADRGMDFGGGTLGNLTDRNYVFVASFNSDDGSHAWSEGYEYDSSMATNGFTDVTDLALDSNENLFVAGWWRGRQDLGAGLRRSSELTSGMTRFFTQTGFVASYAASSGAFRWAQTLEGDNGESVTAVAVDGDDNVYITGDTVETTNFGGGDVVRDTDLGAKLFVAAYNNTGGFLWVTVARNNEAGSSSRGAGIATAAGGVAVSGSFSGRTELRDGVELQSTESGVDPGRLGEDIFVLMLNTDGGSLRWARGFGGGAEDSAGRVEPSVGPDGDLIVQFNPGGTLSVDAEVLEPLGDRTSSLIAFEAP